MFRRSRQAPEHTSESPAANTEPRTLSDNDIAALDLLESARLAERQLVADGMRNYQAKLAQEADALELSGGVYDSLNRLAEVEKDIDELRIAFSKTRHGIKRQADQIIEQRPDIRRGAALSLARFVASRRATISAGRQHLPDHYYPLVHMVDTEWIDGHPIAQGWRLKKAMSFSCSIVNEVRTGDEQREVIEYQLHKGFSPEGISVEPADNSIATDEGLYFVMGIIEATIRQLEQRREFWSQSPRRIRQALSDG